MNGNASGFNFKRRSTVSLSGNFVKCAWAVTSPTFQKLTSYDLFSATGIGQFMGFRNWAAGQGADTTASALTT